MALFAGVQIGFAQIIGPQTIGSETEKRSQAKWDALYIFTYGSVIINLAGAAGAIAILYQATSLESRERRKNIRPSSSDGQLADWELLRRYGMPVSYKWYYRTLIGLFVLGCIFIFVSFGIWLKIAFRPAVTATLIPFVALAALFSLSFLVLSL
jgi:hypothetical protein